MESGLHLYYPGNTVKYPPAPGRKRKEKTMNIDGFLFTRKVMIYEDKVCATGSCLWCDTLFSQYQVICVACGNCQYCGLYAPDSPSKCLHCGNHLPDDLSMVMKLRPDIQ